MDGNGIEIKPKREKRYRVDQVFSPEQIREAVSQFLVPSRGRGYKRAVEMHPRKLSTQICEVQALAMKVHGYTSKQIAEALNMSPRGVEYAIHRALERAGVTQWGHVVDLEIKPEIQEAFDFVRKLRAACAEWLEDPDNPDKFTLAPRANEVQVVYTDPSEMDKFGKPRAKKATLHELLDRVASQLGIEVEVYSHRGADPRKLILEAVDRSLSALDQYAKLIGAYKQPDENPEKVARDETRAARLEAERRAWAEGQMVELRADLAASYGREVDDQEVWEFLDGQVPEMAELLRQGLGTVTESAAVN